MCREIMQMHTQDMQKCLESLAVSTHTYILLFPPSTQELLIVVVTKGKQATNHGTNGSLHRCLNSYVEMIYLLGCRPSLIISEENVQVNYSHDRRYDTRNGCVVHWDVCFESRYSSSLCPLFLLLCSQAECIVLMSQHSRQTASKYSLLIIPTFD
jgi:hypothetical protein